MPSMLTSVALVVCQVSVVDSPLLMVFGLADNEADGAGDDGGGGGGGGAAFFLQAPNNMTAPNINTSVVHCSLRCFTVSPP